MTPINTTPTTVPAAMKEVNAGGKDAATKTVASIIKVGKRPLHGTKLLVRMAIKRSRGESITRVAGKHPAPEIGERLFISPKTVDTYKQRINEKLGLSHRADYVQFALRLGLLAQP